MAEQELLLFRKDGSGYRYLSGTTQYIVDGKAKGQLLLLHKASIAVAIGYSIALVPLLYLIPLWFSISAWPLIFLGAILITLSVFITHKNILKRCERLDIYSVGTSWKARLSRTVISKSATRISLELLLFSMLTALGIFLGADSYKNGETTNALEYFGFASFFFLLLCFLAWSAAKKIGS